MLFKYKKITLQQSIDTGMAFVLICLLLSTVFFKIDLFNYVAIIILVVTMTVPRLLRPFAFVWFGLSHFLGVIVSKVILSMVFYFLVTPIGKIVNIFKDDSLHLQGFKQSTQSVFKSRNHLFTQRDLIYPY